MLTKESTFSKYLIMLPGGPWTKINYLEMVQRAIVRWSSPARTQNKCVDHTKTPYFIFSPTTIFKGYTLEGTQAELEKLANTINRALPNTHVAKYLAPTPNTKPSVIEGALFHSHLKDVGLLVIPYPLAEVLLGDDSTAKLMLEGTPAEMHTRFPANWLHTYAPSVKGSFTNNFPIAQVFYDCHTPTANMLMLESQTTQQHITIHHRSPHMAICLRNITRPVFIQKHQTHLGFDLYF
jgi:hypothetical protein